MYPACSAQWAAFDGRARSVTTSTAARSPECIVRQQDITVEDVDLGHRRLDEQVDQE